MNKKLLKNRQNEISHCHNTLHLCKVQLLMLKCFFSNKSFQSNTSKIRESEFSPRSMNYELDKHHITCLFSAPVSCKF